MSEYQKFNVNEQKSTTAYTYKPKDPIEEGIYEAIITGLRWQDNNKKDGKYLLVNVTILNENLVFPETIFIKHYLNLKNPHNYAQSKATEEFTQLLSAIGIIDLDYNPEKGPAPHEYKRIIFKPLKVRLIIKDGQNNQRVNAIEGFYGNEEAVISQKNKSTEKVVTPPSNSDNVDKSFEDLNDNIPF